MTTVQEVWNLLRAEISPGPVVGCDLPSAPGKVLREDVSATEDQPPFDRSAVDGFLVRKGDSAEVYRLVGEIRAGRGDLLEPKDGETLRIATGAAVPHGDYEVIMLEEATVEAERVIFSRRGRQHIRRRGEDTLTGQVVVGAGNRLGPGSVALLASLGCVRPRVSQAPQVLHLVTGDEIVPPEVQPVLGQVRDANSALVQAWAGQCGLSLSQQRLGEDLPSLRRALAGTRPLLLISGGASVGRHDHTAEALLAGGFDILVQRVSVRPGKPLIVARRGPEWAFGLPGNPLSHFVCLHVFVAAAIAAMEGAPPQPFLRQGKVSQDVHGNPRETWWPAVELAQALSPLPWASSGDLTALAQTDVLLRVPASGLAAGEVAEFIRVR